MNKAWKRRAALAGLILLPILLYIPALPFSFLYDDFRFIVQNPAISSPAKIVSFFTDPATVCPEGGWEGIYRPMRTLSYSIDRFFFGGTPWGYHLHSILLHAANTALVYFVLLGLFKRRGPAFLAALFFAVHPVQAETVAWLSSRDSLLCLFFGLLSLLFLLSSTQKRGFAPLSLLFFVLALFSRETALVFPAILLGSEILPSIKNDNGRRRWPVWIYLPLFVLSAGYLLLRISILGEGFVQRGFWGGGLVGHLQYVLKGFAVNIFWFLFPTGFHFDYQVPPAGPFPDPAAAAGFLLLLAFLVAFFLFRKKGAPSFGILWFLLALLPTSNLFFALNILVADRFLYICLPGLCLLSALLSFRLYGFQRLRPAMIPLLLVVSGCLCFFSEKNIANFRDGESLWKAVIAVSPNNFRAHHGLAAAYVSKNLLIEAKGHLQAAVSLNPGYSLGHRDLGRLYLILSQNAAAAGEKKTGRERKDQQRAASLLWQKGLHHLRRALSLMKEEPFYENHADYQALKKFLEEQNGR